VRSHYPVGDIEHVDQVPVFFFSDVDFHGRISFLGGDILMSPAGIVDILQL